MQNTEQAKTEPTGELTAQRLQEIKAQAAIEEVRLWFNEGGTMMARIDDVIEAVRESEAAKWQERERVYREALEDAGLFAVVVDNLTLAARCRKALTQAETNGDESK